MSQNACVFCKIIRGEIPVTFLHETDDLVAFNDHAPKASTHVLIVPRRHIEHVGTASDGDAALLGALLIGARDVARQLSLSGFKLAINNGSSVGQSVPHLHIHLLSGQIIPGGLQSL